MFVALTALARVPKWFSRAKTWSPWFDDWVQRPPTWLKEYRAAYTRLRRSPYYTHTIGRGFEAQLYCSYDDRSIPELIECLQRLATLSDAQAIKVAVENVDRRMRPQWVKHKGRLDAFARSMQTVLDSPGSAELMSQLRWFYDLEPSKHLDLILVLALIPPHGPKYKGGGNQFDAFMTLGVNLDQTPSKHAQTFFHELAHLAHRHTRYEESFDLGLAAGGTAGSIARSYADEAIASAFGQGLAAERLEPEFDPAKAVFYHHPAIDRIGRGLYQYWRDDRSIRYGNAFGQQLARITLQSYPPTAWTFADYLSRCVLLHTHDQVITILRSTLRPRVSVFKRWVLTVETIPDSYAYHLYKSELILVILPESEMAKRPKMLEQFGTTKSAMHAFLSKHKGGYFWNPDTGKWPLLLITGRDANQMLRSTQSLFSRARKIKPIPGWHAI